MHSLRRLLGGIVSGVVLAALAPGGAGAQLSVSNTCGGNNFVFCFALSDFAVDEAANTFTFTLENNTSASYPDVTFTAFLIGGVTSGFTVESITASDGQSYDPVTNLEGPPDANAENAFQGQGFAQGTNFVGYDNNGNVGVTIGAPVTFTFQVSDAYDIAAADFYAGGMFNDAIQFAIHAQRGPEACGGSSKLVAEPDANGGADVITQLENLDPRCDGDFGGGGGGGPDPVVPEPSTYVLLGSGLLGLAAVARRRRR